MSEFERAYRSWNTISAFPANPLLSMCARDLTKAHEADVAAKDKSIVELEAQVVELELKLSIKDDALCTHNPVEKDKDKYIAELEERIKVSWEGLKLAWKQHNRIWVKVADLKLHNRELEAQVPKVVVPTEHDRKRGTAYCACEAMIAEWDKYCNECGAQLNWEGLK